MNDMENFEDWIGRSETTECQVTAEPADILSATFDRDDAPLQPGDPIPPGWHWYYFHEVVRLADTGPDGHPKRGGFMPPVPLPRRMWAGSELSFHRPITVGERITKTSTITDVTVKDGKTGVLCFVTVRHEIAGRGGLATVEDHTTVYRGAADPNAPMPKSPPAPAEAVWRRIIHPSPVMLFRYSAVTMNSHRIHYDHVYVTEVEGYPGLVVHGPLTTTLLLDLFRREMPDATPTRFKVRAVSPLFDTHDFTVEGAPGEVGAAKLWALNHEGGLSQSAEIEFEV
jgi:3-methylfumaryl-CoA hydratase